MADAFGDALYWSPQDPTFNGLGYAVPPRPDLPALAGNATESDRRLYAMIQQLYQSLVAGGSNDELGQALVSDAGFGIDNASRSPHTDPNILDFLTQQTSNAKLKDYFSPFGDELFPVLLGLGLVGGGAAAAGGFGAEAGATGAEVGAASAAGGEAIASPLPVAGLEGYTGAITTAGGTGGAGTAAGIGAAGPGVAGTAGEFAGTGGSLLAGGVGDVGASGLTLGTATGSGGILGTGITAAQLKAAASALSTGSSLVGLASGGGGGAGGLQGTSTTTGTSNVLDPQTAQLLQTVLGDEFPTRFHGWLDVLNSFVQRANASPTALNDLASPQLRAMGQAILEGNRTASQTLGPYGGAQLGRVQGRTAAAQPVLEAYTSPWLQGENAASGFVGSTQLPIARGATSQSTTTYPPNLNTVAQLFSGLTNLGLVGQKAYNAFTTPTTG